jgi:proteasome assembly chaperone (PAC2) family protein
MTSELLILDEKPPARHLIAGWKRQWSDGGNISSGLPQYLVDQLGARKIGRMGPEIQKLCYPFQVSGTHDSYRPAAAFQEGLPSVPMHWDNDFYDAGNGLIIFIGEEPWFDLDRYGNTFFQAVRELGIEQTVTVEGYNGPAPPDLERRVGCVYSRADMKESLEKYGIQFSNYGSGVRQGPTVGMALVNLAHYRHPDLFVFRLGAMAPMYPFSTTGGQPVGIVTDYRSFFDIMRRIKAMFNLDLDLSDLETRGNTESGRMREVLERIGSSNPKAKEIIDRVRADYSYLPFEETVELAPGLDRTLDDILGNILEPPPDP